MGAFNDTLSHARTLNEVICERADRQGNTVWLTLYAKDKVACRISYAELLEGAAAWAGHLAGGGVEPGDRVFLILPTERAFYEAYWGILLAGAVPVPAYPPVRMGRIDEYLDNLAGMVGVAGARIVVTNPVIRPLIRPLEGRVTGGVRFVVPGEVTPGGRAPGVEPAPDDLALLQFTSGSTGNQKGVMLTHANLLANLRAIGHGIRPRPDDVAVSWLPLYHDMGLIGLMLGSLYFGVPLVATSPIDFLRKPVRWIRMLSEHRATLTAGPNFAYSLVARKARESDLEGADLSRLRVALCGAEPIHPATIQAFTRRFERYGFRPEAFFPAYGLAENTLAVSFMPLGEPPRIERVYADLLEAEGRAERCNNGKGKAREVVSVGLPLPTVEVAVVDEAGRPLPEGRRGEVVVRGPSVMAGYFRNPEATAETLRDGWLHTGDLGFFLDGHLYVSGRKKDLVIKAGRNYFAEDLEAAAAQVEGVRPGGVCAFSVARADRGTEEVILVAEVRDSGSRDLEDAIRRRVSEATGCRPDRVVLVPARTLPKTSSGKIQRFRARAWYLDGSLEHRGGERSTTGLVTYAKAWLRERLGRVGWARR